MMNWTLTDGSIPSTHCERCQRPTPILVRGLGFDCCADEMTPAEALQADDEQPVITIRFGLCLALLTAVLIGAHVVWSAGL